MGRPRSNRERGLLERFEGGKHGASEVGGVEVFHRRELSPCGQPRRTCFRDARVRHAHSAALRGAWLRANLDRISPSHPNLQGSARIGP